VHKIYITGIKMGKEEKIRLKPVRRTTLLDDVTIKILEDYGMSKSGTTNISSAIRHMARDFDSRSKR
jgi:hypothetical protein